MIDLSLSDEQIIENPLELFFQEIELAIKIGPKQIWGVINSIDLNRYVLNKYISLNQIKNEISNYVQNNCEHAQLFQWDCKPEMLKVEDKELLYIQFNIYNNANDNSADFIQKFLIG